MSTYRKPIFRRHAILSGQEGFTLILTLLVLLITSMLLVAAFTAANGEIHLTSTDTTQKKAYYAAEAGLEDYEYHLTQDGNYLSFCTTPTPPNPALNQVSEKTKNKAPVPGSTEEEYAIRLLPAESSPEQKCNPNKLVETMVEREGPAAGTFRISSTGFSGKQERTIVATFRNANFVSYVWYDKYETFDPVMYGSPLHSTCENFYKTRPGPPYCDNNYFVTGESVNGPMHTADHVGICGAPVFGRTKHDLIEFGTKEAGVPTDEGYSNEGLGGCGVAPVFKGEHIPVEEVKSLEPPPGDEELQHIVETGYEFKGRTEIALEGETMSVSQWKEELPVGSNKWIKETKSGVAFPSNGVIYVSGSCSVAYSPFGPTPAYYETGEAACGNAYVHGNYTKSLTIAAQNDVIINKNITTTVNGEGTPTTNALLGLIANNFVRVYHPVVETYEGTGPELETTGVQLESAGHNETIRAEPLESGLRMEVKNEEKSSVKYFEVVLLNAKAEVLEKTGMLTEASHLLTLKSKYIKYTEGTKYAEGETEILKAFGLRSFGVVKISPKSPNLGKELQVEVEEGVVPTKSKVKIKREGVPVEEKEVEKASQLTGSTSYFSYEQIGASHAQGEKEKLRMGVSKWLDEKCNVNGQKKIENFNSTERECEYTDEATECDAPNATVANDHGEEALKNPTIYASILALKHAFIVDNYNCGTPSLEKLNVYGTIAALFSNGLTGVFNGGGTIIHGYPYNAIYDNRLQVEEPPHFLNPLEAAWYIQRQTLSPNP